jgi:hypothetical protein
MRNKKLPFPLKPLVPEVLASTLQQSTHQNQHEVATKASEPYFKKERALGKSQISSSLRDMSKL